MSTGADKSRPVSEHALDLDSTRILEFGFEMLGIFVAQEHMSPLSDHAYDLIFNFGLSLKFLR